MTFQEVYKICEADIKTKGEDMLRFTFSSINKSHGANQLQRVFAETNCDFEKFVADGNLTRFLEVHVSVA